jgi:hydrogenase nickel incorporation protein HypB
LKYPATFHRADLVVLNKVDLLPYVPFRMELAREYIRRVQPDAEIVEVSCTTGVGLDAWRRWLDAKASVEQTSGSGRPLDRAIQGPV